MLKKYAEWAVSSPCSQSTRLYKLLSPPYSDTEETFKTWWFSVRFWSNKERFNTDLWMFNSNGHNIYWYLWEVYVTLNLKICFMSVQIWVMTLGAVFDADQALKVLKRFNCTCCVTWMTLWPAVCPRRLQVASAAMSRRRVSVKELGIVDCEGWLLRRKEGRSFLGSKWKRYWFVLKKSSLYWYTDKMVSLKELITCFHSAPTTRVQLPATGFLLLLSRKLSMETPDWQKRRRAHLQPLKTCLNQFTNLILTEREKYYQQSNSSDWLVCS